MTTKYLGHTETAVDADMEALLSALPSGVTPATLRNYLTNQRIVNVLDEGAYGDESHDDQAAVQSVLDYCYARGGGLVRLPQGKFLIPNGLTLYQSVQLIGDGGGKEDHTGGGGGGETGTQFVYDPSVAGTFLTVQRDPAGLNPSALTNAVCSAFGIRNEGPSGSDGIYFKNASFLCRDVWVKGFAGGKAFRTVSILNSAFEQCMAFFSGFGLFMDPTGGLSTTLSLRGFYSASNTVNYRIQNVLGFNADGQTISESPVTDGWQIDNATRVSLHVYNENVPGYVVNVGSQNNGTTTDLVIDEFNFQTGAANEITKDMIYLQHADGVRIRLLNPAPERASIVRATSTVANLKVSVPWGGVYTNQRATPGSARANSHAYTKGTLFTAVGDDAVTRTYIVTAAGTSAGSQPAGYGIGTLNLADGTAAVSRYTTSTEWPVIDQSLQLTSGWGDEQVRRVVGAGSVYSSNGSLEFSASAGWGFGVSAVVDARDVGGRITITSGSSSLSVNPTLTLVFKDGAWPGVPAIVPARGDHASPTTAYWEVTTRSPTGCTFTFVGTPGISSVYVLDWLVVGK